MPFLFFGLTGLALGTAIAGIAGAIGTGFAGILSSASAARERQQQLDIYNDTKARDDNAMQRAVADTTAAGFSPLAAIGNPSATTVAYDGSAAASMENQAAAQFGQAATSLGQLGAAIASTKLQEDATDAEVKYKKALADAALTDAQTRRLDALNLINNRDAANRRSEGEYIINRDYARTHDAPYGAYEQTDRIERLLDGIAQYSSNSDVQNGYARFLNSVFGDDPPWILKILSVNYRDENMGQAAIDKWREPYSDIQSETMLSWLTQHYGPDAMIAADGTINGHDIDWEQMSDDFHKMYQQSYSVAKELLDTHKISSEDFDELVTKYHAVFDMTSSDLKRVFLGRSSSND